VSSKLTTEPFWIFPSRCPGADCDRVAANGPADGCCEGANVDGGCALVAKCTGCSTVFCFRCGEGPHVDQNECTAATPSLKNTNQQRIKSCPKCSVQIEKNGGCNHMTCRQCRHEFCWICLGDYNGEHYCGGIDGPEGGMQMRRLWIEFVRRNRHRAGLRRGRAREHGGADTDAAPIEEIDIERAAMIEEMADVDLAPVGLLLNAAGADGCADGENFEAFVRARRGWDRERLMEMEGGRDLQRDRERERNLPRRDMDQDAARDAGQNASQNVNITGGGPAVDQGGEPAVEEMPPFDVNYICESLEKIGSELPDESISAVLQTKYAMDRFEHYRTRYEAHEQGQVYAERQIPTVADRSAQFTQLRTGIGSATDGDFVGEANKMLVHSRRLLKHTYAYAFYTYGEGGGSKERGMFRLHQERLERHTEELSRLSENPRSLVDKARTVDQIGTVDRCMQNISHILEFGTKFSLQK